MPKQERYPTNYPGVYYVIGKGSDGKPERIYYIRYVREGKKIEERAGRQFQDDMSPAKANNIRTDRVRGRVLSNAKKREQEQIQKPFTKPLNTILCLSINPRAVSYLNLANLVSSP